MFLENGDKCPNCQMFLQFFRSGIGFMRGKDGDPETASEGDTSSLVNDVNDQSSFREADINTFR